MTDGDWIPLRRPRLPAAEELLPYLRRIDASGRYSNFGPLCGELEGRLAAHVGTAEGTVATACSGTAGLTAALQGVARRDGRYCLMPSFTFPGTPAAAVAAGLEPRFADIDPDSLMLTPARAEAACGNRTDVAAVMPVSAFGAPLDVAGWEAFEARTGIPVVLDAAWCFDSLHPSRLPQVISLHATKVLGVGEGGAVVSTDEALIAEVRQRTNFGLDAERRIEFPAGNAKLPEYSAAVGHAALDAWPERRDRLAELHGRYGRALAGVPGIDRVFTDTRGHWVTATVAVVLSPGWPAADAVAALAGRGVEARTWWGEPCHRQPAYRGHAGGPMPATDNAAASVLNLPLSDGMVDADVDRVCEALRTAGRRAGAREQRERGD